MGFKKRRPVTFSQSFERGGEGVDDATRRDMNFFVSRVLSAAWYSLIGEPVESGPAEADDDPALDS